MLNKALILLTVAGLVTGFVLWFTRGFHFGRGTELEKASGIGSGTPGLTTLPPTELASGEEEPALHQVLADPIVVGPSQPLPISEQDVSSQVDGVIQEVRATSASR